MSQENLVEFEDYLAAIKRRRMLIVVVVAVFMLLGALVSVLSTKEYTAESRVSVAPTSESGEGASEEVNIDTERGIAQSSAVATIAQDILGTDASPSDLLARVNVNPVGESTILAIRYTHVDPEEADRGADAFAQAYLDFRASEADAAARQTRQQLKAEQAAHAGEITGLEAELEKLTPWFVEYADLRARIRALEGAQATIERQLQDLSSDAVDPGTIIDEAEIPISPSSPGLVLNLAGGALIGLVLALTATFVLERRNLGARHDDRPADGAADRRVPPDRHRTSRAPFPAAAAHPPASADRRHRRDPSTVLTGLGVEVLGSVPRLSNHAGEAAFDAVTLAGPAGEALRRLHAALRRPLEQRRATVVLVTSAVERGVTVGLAGGLAVTAAMAGQEALLIAGDLHHPRLHDLLGLANDQGLAEVLKRSRPLAQVLQGWSGIETLCVVTAGQPSPDPSALVSADRLASQLATVRSEFQLIVIEGPPVGAASDALVMASVSDTVVLAVDPRHSAEQELGGAVSRLRLAGAELLGAVVVEARTPRGALPAVSVASTWS